MSTSDEEEPPRKKRHIMTESETEKQLQDTIEENVELFIAQRYEDTNIHV